MANPVNGFHWGYFTPKSVGAYPPSSEENPSGGDVDVWKTMEMPNSRPYQDVRLEFEVRVKGWDQWIYFTYFINGVYWGEIYYTDANL